MVFSAYGLCMKGTVKETLGAVNQPIVIGGVAIHPGDICQRRRRWRRGRAQGEHRRRREGLHAARDEKEAGVMKALRVKGRHSRALGHETGAGCQELRLGLKLDRGCCGAVAEKGPFSTPSS